MWFFLGPSPTEEEDPHLPLGVADRIPPLPLTGEGLREKMALHFELVTPEKLVRSEDVHMVVVPGTEGDFGVLEGHAPVMAVIRPGELTIYSSATTVAARIQLDGGFAEVNEKGLTVLAESAIEA